MVVLGGFVVFLFAGASACVGVLLGLRFWVFVVFVVSGFGVRCVCVVLKGLTGFWTWDS